MRFYVAGAFIHKPEINRVQAELQKLGHAISHDWTVCEADGAAPSPAELREYSANDIGGVRSADAVVVVLSDPGYPYRGTFSEMGAAIALEKKIYIVDTMGDAGYSIRRAPFYHDARVEGVFPSTQALIDFFTLPQKHKHDKTQV